METFSLIKPSAVLAPFIRYYWILRIDTITPVTERTIPVGCIHLTFHRGRQLYSPTTGLLQPHAFICGQSGTYADVTSTGNIDMISVIFQSYAPRLFFSDVGQGSTWNEHRCGRSGRHCPGRFGKNR